MNIILNENLVEKNIDKLYQYSLSSKLKSLANKNIKYEDNKYHLLEEHEGKTFLANFGLVGLLSFAYTNHLKVALTPNDFWIVVLSEISKKVNENPQTYRDLFTTSSNKEEILIPYGSNIIPTDIFSTILSSKVMFDSKVLFPDFSTNTDNTTQFLHSIFCDMSSSYYSYTMFCCGIKEIKLLGTKEDWSKLFKHTEVLLDLFSQYSPNLKTYKNDVLEIFSDILLTFEKNDKNYDFWLDIFTSKNIGSGGDLEVNGWIKNLFIEKHSINKIQNFENTYSSVNYKVISLPVENYKEISGGFETEMDDDNFYSLKYSKHILKLEDKAE